MIKKNILFVLLLSFFWTQAQNIQTYQDLIPKLIQSPNTAALNKFIEFPVNNFNGTADVSFPLYEISLKKLNLPISLKYHTGGIRVNEEASWVGLGWALNVGGSITRQINGKDDHKGYLNKFGDYVPNVNAADNLYNPGIIGKNVNGKKLYDKNGNLIDIVDKLIYGLDYDSQPDLYLYNIGNYAGKFIKDKNQAIIDLSCNDIRFQHYYTAGSIIGDYATAVTPDGNTYIFKDREMGYSVTGIPTTNNPVDDYTTPATNSYLLSEIITPDGEKVKFTYKSFYDICIENSWQSQYPGLNVATNGFCINSISLSENHTQINATCPVSSVQGLPTDCFYNSSSNSRLRSYTFSKTLFLTKIETPKETIEFQHGIRQDNFGVKLEKITIKNNRNEIVKSFNFNYDYFQGSTAFGCDAETALNVNESYKFTYPASFSSKRLKLLSFSENESSSLIHKFYYNEQNMPLKTSFEQDFWGYYNGAYNKTLLPSYDYNAIFSIPSSFATNTEGANRNVDIDKIKMGVLQEIVYPTGGKTVFNYEPNKVINFANCKNYIDRTIICKAMDPETFEPQSPKTVITPFTLTQETLVDIEVILFRDPNVPVGSSTLPSNYHYVTLEKKHPVYINDWVPYKDNYIWNSQNGSISFTVKDQTLAAGQYRLVANYPDNYTASIGSNMAAITLVKKVQKQLCDDNAGGLRIAEMKHKDTAGAPDISTTYTYSNGILTTHPLYTYTYDFEHIITAAGANGNGVLCLYRPGQYTAGTQMVNKKIFIANPIRPFSYSANGSLVGYQKVTETKSGGGNGKTEYEYNVTSDQFGIQYSSVPGLPTLQNLKNGLVNSIKSYDNALNLVSEKKYDYVLKDPYAYWGFAVGPGIKDSNGECDGSFEWVNTFFYPILKGKYVTTRFDDIEGVVYESRGKTTIYNYNIPNFYFPTSIIESRSDGKTNKRDILYSTQYNTIWNDLNGSQRGAYQNLVNQNRIIPIQETSYIDNDFISSSRINYKQWDPSGFISPESIVTKYKDQSSYETQGFFSSYDDVGNIVETQKKDGIPVCYIWGYNKTLLVAKIDNINYSSISSVLISAVQTASNTGTEQQLLDALKQLRESLPNTTTMVTTYTHKPLVGIKSIMDQRGQITSFYYDTFNRLQHVTDHDGNVMSKNAYNYQNITNP